MRFYPLIILALLLSGCHAQHHMMAARATSQLEVRGEASIRVAPDQVEMSLEAVTQAASAEEALARNSAAVETLRELFAGEGLSAADYQTGQFSIKPQWSRPPRPAPANWSPEIVGYRVSNSLRISTARIDLAGRLLALAQQAGVNKAGHLSFSLADPEAASRQAIEAATAKARLRAETLARAAGVKLGSLLEARVEERGGGARPMLMMAEAASARSAVNNIPISAGDVEVRAAVVLRYTIAD